MAEEEEQGADAGSAEVPERGVAEADEPSRRRVTLRYDSRPAVVPSVAAEPTPSAYSGFSRGARSDEGVRVSRPYVFTISRKILLKHWRTRRRSVDDLGDLEDSPESLEMDLLRILESGDVEQAIYDHDFASRMRYARLARARRAHDWAERWLALEDEYERRRGLARQMLGDWVVDVDLHDGHVAEVEIDARAFVEHGQELLRRAPRVRHVHLTGYRSMGPSFFGCSLLRGMQSLGLAEQALSDEDVEALVASPHVDGLRWLDLSGNHLSHRAFEALASCEALARLEYLGLEDNESESPVDRAGTDAMDGSVVSTTRTEAGRALERLAGRTLRWLHTPARFPTSYPPSPLDVAASG